MLLTTPRRPTCTTSTSRLPLCRMGQLSTCRQRPVQRDCHAAVVAFIISSSGDGLGSRGLFGCAHPDCARRSGGQGPDANASGAPKPKPQGVCRQGATRRRGPKENRSRSSESLRGPFLAIIAASLPPRYHRPRLHVPRHCRLPSVRFDSIDDLALVQFLAGGTAAFSNSGLGLLTIGHVDPSAPANVHLLSSLQLDGQFDMDDLVLGVFIARVLVVIALLGLAIACSHHSCVRTAVCLLYYVTSLPAAVALGFAVTFCLAFRSSRADRSPLLCLLLTEPQHMNGAAHRVGAAAAVYQSVTLAAMMLLACVVLLLAFYAASRVIGPGVIAHHMLNVINCGQLVGAGLCAVAAGLHARADGSVHADAALRPRRLRARHELPWPTRFACRRLCPRLLRLYGAGDADDGGARQLRGWPLVPRRQGYLRLSFLESNWHYVRQVYPLSKEAFTQLLRNHWKAPHCWILLTIVQLLVLGDVCVPPSAASGWGRRQGTGDGERARGADCGRRQGGVLIESDADKATSEREATLCKHSGQGQGVNCAAERERDCSPSPPSSASREWSGA